VTPAATWLLTSASAEASGGFFTGEPASQSAASVDFHFSTILLLGSIALAAVFATICFLSIKYRRRDGQRAQEAPASSSSLLATLILVPIAVVVMLFVGGWHRYIDLTTPPVRAPEIKVVASTAGWQFHYPNGVTDSVLHLPAGRSTRLKLTSDDYIHGFYLPAFRLEQVAVPGRYTRAWVKPDRAGSFYLQCAKYCGAVHSQSTVPVLVYEPEAYDEYMAELEAATKPPGALGLEVYIRQACSTCHTIDGSKSTGPTFKGLYAKKEKLQDGSTVEVDEEYLRESIVDPKAKLVDGFQPVMQPYEEILTKVEIDAVIDYLKSLK
jgi:cytochrome c oxidase subunit 2